MNLLKVKLSLMSVYNVSQDHFVGWLIIFSQLILITATKEVLGSILILQAGVLGISEAKGHVWHP